MKQEYVIYAVAAGIAGIAGSWIGKRWLKKVSETKFRQIVIALMVVSAVLILWQQRQLIAQMLNFD